MRTILVLGTGIWLTTMAAAAAPSRQARPRDPDWVAPAAQAAKMNPLADRPDLSAGGSKLFHQRCSVCHGEDARGTSRGPNLTPASAQQRSDGELFWKISSGNTRTGMPAFSFLPPEQRWQIVMHLRSRGK